MARSRPLNRHLEVRPPGKGGPLARMPALPVAGEEEGNIGKEVTDQIIVQYYADRKRGENE